MVKLFLRKIISFVLDFLVFCPYLWLLYKIMFECMCQWKGGVCLPPPHSGENEPVSLRALHLWPSGLQGNAVILVLPALFAFTTESNNYDSLENLLYLGLQRVPCASGPHTGFQLPLKPCGGACSDYVDSPMHSGTNCCPGKFNFKASCHLSKWHCQVAFTKR